MAWRIHSLMARLESPTGIRPHSMPEMMGMTPVSSMNLLKTPQKLLIFGSVRESEASFLIISIRFLQKSLDFSDQFPPWKDPSFHFGLSSWKVLAKSWSWLGFRKRGSSCHAAPPCASWSKNTSKLSGGPLRVLSSTTEPTYCLLGRGDNGDRLLAIQIAMYHGPKFFPENSVVVLPLVYLVNPPLDFYGPGSQGGSIQFHRCLVAADR